MFKDWKKIQGSTFARSGGGRASETRPQKTITEFNHEAGEIAQLFRALTFTFQHLLGNLKPLGTLVAGN